MSTCWIIAGPNGAGKTTFALEYLPHTVGCLRFVNADLIAAGLSPLAPQQQLAVASRLFLAEIQASIQHGADFAFETTLAGRAHLRLIHRLRAAHWRVELVYLALPDVAMSRLRVAERVAHGGHHVPLADIERRFPRSLTNLLEVYSGSVDGCRCFMNHGATPELVFEQVGTLRNIVHPVYYEQLRHKAQP